MTSSLPNDLAILAKDGTARDQAIQERIQAAARVNASLYAQIENYVSTLDRTEQERDAWAEHARSLAQKLVQARKRISRLERALSVATGQPHPAVYPLSTPDTGTEDADEDARQLAELLQLQLSAAGPELQAAAATAAQGQMRVLAPVQMRAAAAALYPASRMSAKAETLTAEAAESEATMAAAVAEGPLARSGGGAPASVPINPTPNQHRVLEALVQRGQAMGWLVQLSEVTLGSVLGEGEFGVTYLGTWRHAAVAVKVVRLRHAAELSSFLREVETMSYLRHPNVVPFLGACLTVPDKLMLVSEYMTGGTLCEWLHPDGLPAPGSSSRTLNDPQMPLLSRLKMAHQVALGMCALESCRPEVLHRDLKPANVYLDARGVPRVGDFGLSRRLLEEARASLTGETGTYFYMAPEVMRHEVYDTKADVWSWGVLLSECITCAMPYGHLYMGPVQVAQEVAAEQLAPTVPQNIDDEVQLVLRLACQFDPNLRPDFASLADMLGSAIRHLEAKEAVKPTLLASIQSSLLSAWSGAWGRGTSFARRAQQQRQQQQQQVPQQT